MGSPLFISEKLSEIAGIHAGDGHLRKNGEELEISGSFEEKEYYDACVIPLFNSVFDLKLKGRYFLTKGTYGFRVSNLKIKQTLLELGFPLGKKSDIVRIPEQILSSRDKTLQVAFLRGLCDTDGSISFDKKMKNSNFFKKYRHFYPRVCFSTTSEILARQVYSLLKELGFYSCFFTKAARKPTQNISYDICLNGKDALLLWMSSIKPSNQVKFSRYSVWQRYGFCPPKTTYEQRQKILKGELNPNSLYGPVM